MFSQQEFRRYHRHIILPEFGLAGQEKLKKASVLVVGAGGLGCPILQYLTAAGVGRIGIIDFDTIDESNLQRQVLYTSQDIGKPKVQVAQQRLQAQNPHIQFDIHFCRISSDNALQIMANYDIIVDGSDNFATRYLVNDASVILGKPLVFGAIYKFEGQASVFNYQSGGTYRCLFPEPTDPEQVPNCNEAGVLGVLPALVGSIQANEVIKIITGIGEVLRNKLLIFDALTMKFTTLKFEANPQYLKIAKLQNNNNAFCSSATPENQVATISAEELKRKIQENHDIELIDVRQEIERQIHHIGGKNLPLDRLENLRHQIDAQKTVVVYCQQGKRSVQAIQMLHPYFPTTRFYSLEGGLKNWID